MSRPNTSRILWNRGMKAAMLVSTATTAAFIAAIVLFVIFKGIPNVDWTFLSTKPSYLAGRIGILPNILTTVYIILATLAFVVPLGVGSAIYLTEYATSHRAVNLVERAAETLAGIPSIIYGLVGMLFFYQFLEFQTSVLAGALTLVMMNLPTILRTTEESLKSVPMGPREGAFALGAGKWRVIHTVVLPCCIDGIVTGCILAVGRVVGESAALLFTAGFANDLHGIIQGLESSGATLTVALYVYAKEQGEFGAAYGIALILILLTLIVNFSAVAVGRYFRKAHQK